MNKQRRDIYFKKSKAWGFKSRSAFKLLEMDNKFKFLKKNIISLSWDNKKISLEDYVGRIIIIVLNEPGSLGEIASAIGNNKGNIINLKLTSRKKTFFEMLFHHFLYFVNPN